MASSVVAICNIALDMLGATPITSLEDASKTAALCARNFVTARDAALRSYPWNCASARASLARDTAAPAWGFLSAFPLPVDCLRVIETQDDVRFGVTWRVEGRAILANTTGPLNIRYIRRVEDPALFDELLVQAIAARLAAIIAYPVTGQGSVQERMLAIAAQVEAQARVIDAREQMQDDETTADLWSGARFTSYGTR